ncbi:MAG TPA: hypothetical protein PK052_06130 [Anaerohalosphaeraceae bacterium]|nr:hypothetical protein [Anaerohalosphaeraceae bacterium]HOL31546.1 hypothetical protein [Anaerohalosphaeraceae bacterium]HOM75646.1 hypothetical protein [Anaerohalosphaeraceae bacterium]HPC64438.1 hypothetical protein [Anaerohalosphaeraceae bacterium]HPO68777.1 hypothetical protein [Anaerohalosphaeraceae bacterium]
MNKSVSIPAVGMFNNKDADRYLMFHKKSLLNDFAAAFAAMD